MNPTFICREARCENFIMKLHQSPLFLKQYDNSNQNSLLLPSSSSAVFAQINDQIEFFYPYSEGLKKWDSSAIGPDFKGVFPF